MTATARVTVSERERAIFDLLRDLDDPDSGAPIRQIFDAVTSRLSDTVTEQAYRKILTRLDVTGRIEQIPGSSPTRYRLAAHLHAANALTLDDVYDLLTDVAPTEAIATVTAAREYFDRHRSTTLAAAAERLLNQPPVALFEAFLLDLVAQINVDLDVYRQLHVDSGAADPGLRDRITAQLRELDQLTHRYLGLTRAAVDAPLKAVLSGDADVTVDEPELHDQLTRRVFGPSFLYPAAADTSDAANPVVAGSNGSTHASVLSLNIDRLADDIGDHTVTFNNSAVHLTPTNPAAAPDSGFYSVPLVRSAIDDRSNTGMIMASFMYRYLSPSEYEHMAKAATDVVQWRADLAVFSGTARTPVTGSLLPRPNVYLRDGTLTLQEREWNHYQRPNEYGDIVKEGVIVSRRILEQLTGDPLNGPVFAGAAKTTQTHMFSMILGWYIARGSATATAPAIDPAWDRARSAFISDNEAMSHLLAPMTEATGTMHLTCVVRRTFGSTTEFYDQPRSDSPDEWLHLFSVKQHAAHAAAQRGDTEESYLAGVDNLDDENFVWMCRHADYFSFYIGHTGGNPPPLIPRYEFLADTRQMTAEQADRLAMRSAAAIVSAVRRSGLMPTRTRSVAGRAIARITPVVLYEAAERCKAVGQSLESELKRVVVDNLRRFRGSGIRDSDVTFTPQSVNRFIDRYARSLGDDQPNR